MAPDTDDVISLAWRLLQVAEQNGLVKRKTLAGGSQLVGLHMRGDHRVYMNCSLNSLSAGYIGDHIVVYIGDYMGLGSKLLKGGTAISGLRVRLASIGLATCMRL